VFTDDQKKPTASVLVATAPGHKLNADQVQSVVHLVASSVEGLDADAVTVVGADGMVLSGSGLNATSGGAGGDLRTRQTEAFQQRMSTSLQQMLDQVVGAGHAVVQVTADLDYDQTETKTQKYVADPSTPPLSDSSKTETYTGSGNSVGGVLGPNGAVTLPSGAANGGTYQQQTDIRNNAVGVVTETRKSAPGAVRKLSVAVLLDSKTAKGADQAQMQQIISSAVGLDPTRGDSIAVSTMAFDASAAEAAKKELARSQKTEQQQQLFSMGKTAATVGAVLLLVIGALLSN